MRIARLLGPFLASSITLYAMPGSANFEVPLTYDARSTGMGGTGIATVTNAAAPVHNPANLVGIQQLSVTGTFTPYFSQRRQVFAAGLTATKTVTSPVAFGPFAQLGVAIRLHERVVLGAIGLLDGATGGEYRNAIFPSGPAFVPVNIKIGLLTGELRVPVAVQVSDSLALAVGYRLSFGVIKTATDALGLPPALASLAHDETNLSGANYAGLQAGIRYTPCPGIEAGLTYRSKMTLHLTDPKAPKTNQELIKPHFLGGGIGATFLDQDLKVAFDFKYWLYGQERGNKDLKNWQDAYSGHFGAEYKVTARVPVRVGYTLGRQGVSDRAASFSAPTPGKTQAFTVGAGILLGPLVVDAALAYGTSGGTIMDAPIPGAYDSHSYVGSLSLTYQM